MYFCQLLGYGGHQPRNRIERNTNHNKLFKKKYDEQTKKHKLRAAKRTTIKESNCQTTTHKLRLSVRSWTAAATSPGSGLLLLKESKQNEYN